MSFQDFRAAVQHTVYRIIDPMVKGMIKAGVTPNMVTTIGLIGNLLAAAFLVYSALSNPAPNYLDVGLAGWLILCSSLFDMVDGYLARTGNLCSKFGAFYDSVLDRYCELFTLSAIAFYFMTYQMPLATVVTFLALIGSIMVSYCRARGEALGADCHVGLMQRPERVVVTSLGCILTPWLQHLLAEPLWSLFVPQILIALLANGTAIARILYVRKQL